VSEHAKVTEEVVDVFVQTYVGCPIDPSDREAIRLALITIAPMLAAQGEDDWRERERVALRHLWDILEGYEVRVEQNRLQWPMTYLEEVRLYREYQPGVGHSVAEAMRKALAAKPTGLAAQPVAQTGAPEWLPIESAPKDGARILVCGGDCEEVRLVAWLQDGNIGRKKFFAWCSPDSWQDEQGGFSTYQPILWMPAPIAAAPTPSQYISKDDIWTSSVTPSKEGP